MSHKQKSALLFRRKCLVFVLFCWEKIKKTPNPKLLELDQKILKILVVHCAYIVAIKIQHFKIPEVSHLAEEQSSSQPAELQTWPLPFLNMASWDLKLDVCMLFLSLIN